MRTRIRRVILVSMLTTAGGLTPIAAGSDDRTAGSTSSGGSSQAAEPSTPKSSTVSDRKDLLAIGNGAFVIEKSSEASLNWRAINIIDELTKVGWASDKRKVADQTLLIELPGKTTLDSLIFDTASVDTVGSAAKDIVVEISDTTSKSGFIEVLKVTLKDAQDGQQFKIAQPTAGRWVRLRVKNNYGSADYTEIMDIRGYGEQEPLTPINNVSGTYESKFGIFHIKQEGTSIVGCYEVNEGIFQGGIENRVMTLNWEDRAGSGPAMMVFSQDGRQFLGAYGKGTIDNGFFGEWNGQKISDKIGSCPHLKTLETGKAAEDQIGKDLKESGRATIYGINFDFNSDVIKSESKPTLDQIAAVLTTNKDWKMTVEGHTDNIGGDVFNKTLSEKRASAVKAYLTGKGIDSARLSSSGLGMAIPVASNETAAGRAQNRRVELVKN